MKRGILCAAVLTGLLLLSLLVLPVRTYAAEASSGTCGKDLIWTLDEDGVLTISGTGPMADYGADIHGFHRDPPWAKAVSSIKKIVIQEGVTTIGKDAFDNCTALTELVIANSVTSIGKSAFNHCSSLTALTIPDGITSIGDAAFYMCTGLTDVFLGSGLTDVGCRTFSACSKLTGFRVDEKNTAYCNDSTGVLYNKSKTVLVAAPCGITGEYVVADGVTTVAEAAFYRCMDLTGVKIPGSVTMISKDAFNACLKLTAVTIDNGTESVSSIGAGAFSYCRKLPQITIPGRFAHIANQAFFCCDQLNNVVLGDGVAEIGSNVFAECSSLARITLPGSISRIAADAFYNCVSLKSVYYGGSRTSWENVTVGDRNELLQNAAFVYGNGEVPVTYTVVFRDWDGSVISTKTYHHGDMVAVPANPTRAADSVNTYRFAGWDREVVACTADTAYTAIYTATYIDYAVVFKNWDGSVISSQSCHYGDAVTVPADPTRPADSEYAYAFIGWDKTVTQCAGDTTYIAKYSATPIVKPTEPTEPSLVPTEPSSEPTEPSVEPSVNPTESQTEPTDPTHPSEQPGTQPTEPTDAEKENILTVALIVGAICLAGGIGAGILIARKKR